MPSSRSGWGKGQKPGGSSEPALPDTTCHFYYTPVPFHEPRTYPAHILKRAASTPSLTDCKVTFAAQKQTQVRNLQLGACTCALFTEGQSCQLEFIVYCQSATV